MKLRTHLILSIAVFCSVWMFLTVQSFHDTRQDPDLGIAPAKMSFGDNAIWCLGLALFIWFIAEALLILVLWFRWFQKQRKAAISTHAPDALR